MPLNSFESRVQTLLAKKIEERMRHMADELIGGGMGSSYQEYVGYHRALREVISLCEEVEDELLGRKKSSSR